MKFEEYEKQVKHYEKLTRQYRECRDFLQALKFNDKEQAEYSGIKTKTFVNSNELMISTPAIILGEKFEKHLVYKVNLARDLGMDLTNDDLTAWLIKEVEQRMQVIENELGEVFLLKKEQS